MEVDDAEPEIPLTELLAAELKLDPCQWNERPDPEAKRGEFEGQHLEIDCLVHEEWVCGAAAGQLSHHRVPTVCPEEVLWLLQPSSDAAVPKPWQRVHISCFRKSTAVGNDKSLPVPQCNSYSLNSIHEFLTQVSQENLLLSWQETLRLVQSLPEGGARKAVTSAFVRQLVKQLYDTELIFLSSGEDESNLRRTRDRRQTRSETKEGSHPRSVSSTSDITGLREQDTGVHSNLAPLLAALETKHAFYLIYPYLRFTLFDATIHSPAMIDDSVAKPLFVFFQLLKLLHHCHSKGITLGETSMRNIFVDSRLWVQLRLSPSVMCGSRPSVRNRVSAAERGATADRERTPHVTDLSEKSASPTSEIPVTPGDSSATGLTRSTVAASTATLMEIEPSDSDRMSGPLDRHCLTELASTYVPPALQLSVAVDKWRRGELSNFDYLMVLNDHAGRCLGEANNHPIFPWVMDFTSRTSGLRNLSKSKHRISKGDRQLDFTYISAQEEVRRVPDQDTVIPHHIGDISTDVTYYVYLARRTSKEVLCSRVRPRWVPEEYPSSIEKMYMWSPDECIPEYFVDPVIFKSIHSDMEDLGLPSWCSSPENFISAHRAVLESDVVSSELHHWIDLVFGYKLAGEAAVRAKNVYLSLVDKHRKPTNCGIVQLFKSSHPKRLQSPSAPLALLEWQSYLNMTSVMNVTAFSISQLQHVTQSAMATTDTTDQPGSPEPPRPQQPKTLESILNEQAVSPRSLFRPLQGDSPRNTNTDRNHPLEDDSSFEHVTIPDDLKNNPTGVSHIRLQNSIEIDYEDIPTTSQEPKTPTKPKEKEGGAVLNSLAQQPNRFRVANIFRQRKSNPGDAVTEGYDWQNADVSLPKDSNLLQSLARLEELSHFVNKSCKDHGSVFCEQWKPEDLLLFKKPENRPLSKDSPRQDSAPHLVLEALQRQRENPAFYPSFEERVAIDIAAVTCTVVEMCCVKQLRTALSTPTRLLERIEIIRRLLRCGQLRLPSYLQNVADFVLYPENEQSSFSDLHLPSLSANLLLQPFLPLVSFPSYFQPLYLFLHGLERLCRRSSTLSLRDLRDVIVQRVGLLGLEPRQEVLNQIISYVSENIPTLLRSMDNEGFTLLLLHLFPFFQYPETCFEAVYNYLDPLGKYMSRRNIERLFAGPVIRLFDSPIEPYQRGQLLSRTMADILIRRFGLGTFLSRFLGFIIEAVIEPSKMASKGLGRRITGKFARLQSESVLTLVQQTELLQSSRFDRNASQPSDLSFSYALTESREYDSDKEDDDSSSTKSESPYPEASLLAKPSLVLSNLDDTDAGRPYPDQDGRPNESPSANPSTKSLLQSLGLREGGEARTEHQSLEYSIISTSDARGSHLEDSSVLTAGGQTGYERLQNSLTGSMEYRHPLGNPVLNQSLTSSIGVSEESLRFRSSSDITRSLPVSTHSAYNSLHSIQRQTSLKMGVPLLLEDGEESEEEEHTLDSASMCSADPHTLAINSHISQVAADCISWLVRRLGPFLTTRHIAKPLLENLHRCFTGVVHLRDRGSMAIKCLETIAKIFGEVIVIKFYLPHTESLVTSAMNRMTLKAEAGVAASLALVKMCIHLLTPSTLESVTNNLCDNYIIPMIQLLSSQSTFPSGSKARAAICHSVVQIALQIGQRLGREKASVLLIGTLQCFFTCFSGVHAPAFEQASGEQVNGEGDRGEEDGSEEQQRDATPVADLDESLAQSVGKVVPTATEVESHPLKNGEAGVDSEATPLPRSNTLIEENEAYRQVCATFSPAMAHAAYVPFCILLGQINLNKNLYNTDLIEHIAYSHDKIAQPNSPLPTVWDVPATEPEDSSDSDSTSSSDDSFDDSLRDVAMKLGPVAAAVHSKSGLGSDAAGFGRSSWFVGLEEGGESGDVKGEGANSEDVKGGGGGVPKGGSSGGSSLNASGILQWYQRSFSDGQSDTKTSTLDWHSATFEAKFGRAHSSPDGKTGGTATSSTNELDCTLHGNWETLWESQLHANPYAPEPYNQFKGIKLQTFTGHKASVRSLVLADSEHYFISGSKDKTVKIWSLRNHGDGSTSTSSQYTYTNHQKAVVAVEMLETMGNVLSCDGTIHLWDPETGYCVQQFTSPRNTQFVAMKVLPPPYSVIAVATSDFQLRFIDVRAKSYLHLWKLQFPTGGIVRSLECGENWIAVGNYNGWVNTLDFRTGDLLTTWKPSDTAQTGTWTAVDNLFQLRATRRGNLVSSVGNGLITLWKPTNGKLLHQIRGQTSSAHCLEIMGEQLVSAAANGHVVVHSSFELNKDAPFWSTKVRSRELRYSISCMAALQENQLLLLGGENGHISLMV